MIGHQVQIDVGGQSFVTLADLWPESCRAVIVGVNPAPKSVEIGHYYQGGNGRTAITRLRAACLLPPSRGGFADDEAFASGVGFTDLVKRPTRSANDLTPTEIATGRTELRDKLAAHAVPLVVCVFKPAVTALLGGAGAPGFQTALFGSSRVFRMPGPYDATERVEPVMGELRRALNP